MAIRSKAQLNNTEKLAYPRDTLKDSPARHVVEGLSQDADYYEEAIGYPQRHYDRPRLIHQVHVCNLRGPAHEGWQQPRAMLPA